MPDKKGFEPGVGRVVNGVFQKPIVSGNILRKPERSFTFDQDVADTARGRFYKAIVFVPDQKELYEISAEMFWQNAVSYDYGNGRNYRVAVRFWHDISVSA
jgi:hypothetical protein